MHPCTPSQETQTFYRQALATLQAADLPFLIGGAYAFWHYTGIVRHTKDLDVFVRFADWERTLGVLAQQGYRTEITYPHWLGKAFCGKDFLDILYNSGNGIAAVDDDWFTYAVPGEVYGMAVRFCPPEEMIWSKAFTMERDRYDGADIAHLLYKCSGLFDWQRLLSRFDGHWHVLLSHLILFRYTYPGEQERIPSWIMDELVGRLQNEPPPAPPDDRLCRGTLLTGAQYLVDVERWGYHDARLKPWGNMTPELIVKWKKAVKRQMSMRKKGK